jgi:hypothetical protein
MHKTPVYKQWIGCGMGMDKYPPFYTLSTEQNYYGFGGLFLYKFLAQLINKLAATVHTNESQGLLSGDYINLSTQSTGPTRANLNNLIKGLIV